MDYQRIIFVGRVGRDPEMRYTPGGTPVTGFSVVVNRKYKGSDGQDVKEATWYKVSTFNKLAEMCGQWVKKGQTVLVEGRLNPDQKTGGPKLYQKQDGSYGASFEVIADTVRLGDGGQDRGENQESSAKQDEESNEF